RDDPVQLLRVDAVIRAQARLHVAHRDRHLGRHEGPRQRGVRIPVDEDEVRLLLLEDALEALHHLRGLPRMAPAADPEVMVRRRDVEDLKEDPRHVLVVVLARVYKDLPMVLPDLAAHGGGLDELWPRAHDARDLHMGSEESAGYNRSPMKRALVATRQEVYLAGLSCGALE